MRNKLTFILFSTTSLLGCGNWYSTESDFSYPQTQSTLYTASTRPCEFKPNIGNIRVDCTLEHSKYELISHDLGMLSSLHLIGPRSEEFQQTLNLPNLTGQTLTLWLEERIQYLLAEDFSPSGHDHVTLGENMGSAYYNLAQSLNSPSYIIAIPGHASVTINKPRVGIVRLGPALFSETINEPWYTKRAQSLIRLGALFHEARHSDGNGLSATFPHTRCPSTHPSAGKVLCDESSNGPNAIEVLFLESILENCHDCSFTEKIIIGLEISAYKIRILPTNTKVFF
jgi:hypothetical protein